MNEVTQILNILLSSNMEADEPMVQATNFNIILVKAQSLEGII
jgi:hypothetical protein